MMTATMLRMNPLLHSQLPGLLMSPDIKQLGQILLFLASCLMYKVSQLCKTKCRTPMHIDQHALDLDFVAARFPRTLQ